MNPSDSNPTYVQIAAILSLADLVISASELHGIVCGVVCNQVKSRSEFDVYDLVTTGSKISEASKRALVEGMHELYIATREDLYRGDAGFSLLLPDDSFSVSERTEALAEWCRGFSFGLLYNASVSMDQLPGDAAEIAVDLLAISEATPDAENPEGDEWALAEVEEYVRMGVQLIFEELTAAQDCTPSQGVH